jgi:sec-independent protein translocase protein TatA
MFANLGFTELMVILVIVLVLFGARRVPEIGASIGKGIREFKKNINEIDREVRDPIRDSLRSEDRLAAGTSAPVHREEEASRPEPKRLL